MDEENSADPLLGSAVRKKFAGYGTWDGTVILGPDERDRFCCAWLDPNNLAEGAYDQWHALSAVERSS